MRRISVWKSPTTAPSKCATSSIKPHPPVPTPYRSSHPAPTNVSHPRNRPTGSNPTQMEGRLLYTSIQEEPATTHRSHQRNHRTRKTHRQRLPQPHQLPTPNAPHRRRPRCLQPHSTLKSRFTCRRSRNHRIRSHRTSQPPNRRWGYRRRCRHP